HLSDGCDVGRELYDKGPGRDLFGTMDEVSEFTGVGAECHATGVNIGTGDVELVGRYAGSLVEALDDGDVLGHLIAEDVDDDVGARVTAEGREFVADEL